MCRLTLTARRRLPSPSVPARLVAVLDGHTSDRIDACILTAVDMDPINRLDHAAQTRDDGAEFCDPTAGMRILQSNHDGVRGGQVSFILR